jgi:hypothetical protein
VVVAVQVDTIGVLAIRTLKRGKKNAFLVKAGRKLKTNEVKLSTIPNFHSCATVPKCHFYFVFVLQQAQIDAHVSAGQQDKGKGKKCAESGRGKRKDTNQQNVQPKKKPKN